MSGSNATFVEQIPNMLRSHSSPSNMTHPTPSKIYFTNPLVPGVPTTRFVARNNTKSGGSVSYLVPSYSLIPTTVPSINLVNVTTYAQPNYQCITFIHQQQNYMPFECQDDKKTLIPSTIRFTRASVKRTH